MPSCDLLLINASNYPANPIYPYAFVQTRAVAGKFGLRLDSFDLWGIPGPAVRDALERLIQTTQPRMIGLHLRQLDSLVFDEYRRQQGTTYLPVCLTSSVISTIRSITSAPIVMGGFGFSTQPVDVFACLDADFGVAGEPDDFFCLFEDVVARRDLGAVANLIYRDGGRLIQNPRVFFPPHDGPEYDDEVLGRLTAFYGAEKLFGPNPPTVAIELARGCPYSCYFCTEPRVKGKQVRRRPMSAIEADARFLVSRNIRHFWLVCSELNMGNSGLALEMAGLFTEINRSSAGGPVRWHAYHLPRWLSADDLKYLYASGFVGGWNDLLSFDDDNLKLAAVPYRSRHAVDHLRASAALHPKGPLDNAAVLGFFLGNAYITPRAISRTLEQIYANEMPSLFPQITLASATRYFSGDRAFERDGAAEFLPLPYQQGPAHPTFYLPRSLHDHFGNDHEVLELFDYLNHTILSADYREAISWLELLAQAPCGVRPGVADAGAAKRMVAGLFEGVPSALPKILHDLGLEAEGLLAFTPYRVYRQLIRRFATNDELIEFTVRNYQLAPDGWDAWRLRCLLTACNIQLKQKYRPFFVPEEGSELLQQEVAS